MLLPVVYHRPLPMNILPNAYKEFSMHKYLILVAAVTLAACQPDAEAPAVEESTAVVDPEPSVGADTSAMLAAVLDAQADDAKARYVFRHPQQTMEFFGIEPGMTVLEGLPGGGWYSKILLPYLGGEGSVIGANYSADMWQQFPFANDEFMARIQDWRSKFVSDAEGWRGEASTNVEAFHFGSMPEHYANSVDVAFFPRVLHNAARFQNSGAGDYLTEIISDVYTALKPGGVFGIVQHEARPEMSDEFADGSLGYLKKAWLIEQVEAAGFEWVAESKINANPKDQPTEEEVVWRLPPNYNGTSDDADRKAAVDEVGESNRMTLKFRKPS
jgi:predicted methyltransferase